MLGLSALFTFGQKIDEKLPSWEDVYEFFGMAEEIEKGEVKQFDPVFADIMLSIMDGK